MPHFTTDHPRGAYKFYEQPVTLPHVFASGHPVTELEAKYLNQQVATSVGNRYGAKIRNAVAKLDAERKEAHKAKTYTGPMDESGKKPAPATVEDLGWDHQAEIEKLFADFQPGMSLRGSGEPSLTPLATEMRRLAAALVKDRYKAKGFKFTDMVAAKRDDGRSSYEHHIDQMLDAKHDELESLATQALAALASAKTASDVDLD